MYRDGDECMRIVKLKQATVINGTLYPKNAIVKATLPDVMVTKVIKTEAMLKSERQAKKTRLNAIKLNNEKIKQEKKDKDKGKDK